MPRAYRLKILSSKPSNRVWPLGDQLRLEAANPVARDRNRDLAILRQDRLRARPVAAVAAAAARGIALLVTQMVGQLSAKRPLDQGLLELLEKPIVPRQILGLFIVSQQLIQQLRSNCEIGRHVSLPSKVNSQKPAYTFFLTPSALRAKRARWVCLVLCFGAVAISG